MASCRKLETFQLPWDSASRPLVKRQKRYSPKHPQWLKRRCHQIFLIYQMSLTTPRLLTPQSEKLLSNSGGKREGSSSSPSIPHSFSLFLLILLDQY